MRILFLDDSPERHALTDAWFGSGHEIVRAHNAPECIGLYLLHQNGWEPFDLVSLDHDLGARHDGMKVVDNILILHDHLALPKPRFAIHSWNLPRADQMWFKLKRAGFEVTRKPFSPAEYTSS